MRDPDHSPRLSEDAALRAIVEGVEAETGEEFFASLVRHLATALDVEYAFISELTQGGRSFRTRALWGRGRQLDNVEVPVAGTPCEQVLCGAISHHPDHLQERFPEDVGLAEWGVVSYCGVPVLDAAGTVIGHLAIFDDRPMPDGPRGAAVMRIFAARARAELDRLHAEAALRASEERLARILDGAMDAVVTCDAQRRIELLNPAAERMFACTAAEALGQSLDRFLTPRALALLEPSLAAALGDARPRAAFWTPAGVAARRATGDEFEFEGSVSCFTAGGRRLFTAILRDVEDRRQAEEERRRLALQAEYLQEEIKAEHNFDEIIGGSRALRDVLAQTALVAETDSSVLILGETGTGKELIARAVHSRSRRRDRPLIKVNCSALPAGLVESELFGHEKGAFTGATERRVGRFELANRGTIFLDEVGELPAEAQAKLLRVLQEQEFERIGGSQTIRVDVRVIAATNRDLQSMVAEDTFRRDLYYRLNVFPVHLPPLRERLEDLGLLVHYFVSRYAAKVGRRITRVPAEAMQRLLSYPWPGNVRELENVVERAVILSSGPDLQVEAEMLGQSIPRPVAAPAAAWTDPEPTVARAPSPAGASLREMERQHIVAALQRTRWRIDGPNGAARILDLNPSTLRSRMQKLGIKRSHEQGS